MAEVYRAKRSGAGGFEKVVALKRILPSYANTPTLVERFLQEARIAGGLDHGNLVHVVDFGSADGEYYMVMEWIDGVPLSSLLKRHAETGRPLAPEVVAYVIAEAAVGLHHAHTRTDAAGKPLGIVHRDVSPQNILLGKQGDVKVSDFGIAKIADSLVRTEAGLQVGKLCYMSPEQARGDPLDGRADVYALGVVLWECLALRPLFPRDDGGETLKAVLAPQHVAPTEVSSSAPGALDAVVLKALAPVRDDRYPDAGSLARDLRVYVHSIAPGFGQTDLAQVLQRSMPFGGGAPRLVPTTAPAAPEPGAARASPRAGGRAPAGRRRWVVASVAAAAAVAIAAVLGLVLRARGGEASPTTAAWAPAPAPQATPAPPLALVAPSEPPKRTLSLYTEPSGAIVVGDGELAGTTPLEIQAPIGTPLRMGLLSRGHRPALYPGAPEQYADLIAAGPHRPIRLEGSRETFGLVDVRCEVGSTHVLVDGADQGEEPVLVAIRFDDDRAVTRVELEIPGHGRQVADVSAARPWSVLILDHPVANR